MKEKELQKNLYVEYALGLKPWKKFPFFQELSLKTSAVTKFLKIGSLDQDGRYTLGFDKREASRYGIDTELVMDVMQKDPGYCKYLVGLRYYLDNPKNYIFSPYLTTLLKGTGSDIKCELLHKEASGYIEMPGLVDADGDKVLGILFRIYKDVVWQIHIVWLLEHPSCGMIQSYFYENIDSGLISDVVANTLHTDTHVIRKENGEVDVDVKSEYNPNHVWGTLEYTTINAILWILYKKDMVQKLNEFAQKNSKREVQERLYTKLPFYECDIERSFTVDSSFTKGHLRLAMLGPRSNPHLDFIYIRPYTRNLKKYDKGEKDEGK